MKTHLGFRASARLQEAINQVGDASAAARALIIIGLARSGHDVSSLIADGESTFTGVRDPSVKQALREVLYSGVTPVTRVLNTPQLQLVEEEEEETDPFASIGIAV